MATLNPTDELQYLGGTYSVRLLSEVGEVDGRKGLLAMDLETEEPGLWTMVYDEGLEVRFKDRSFFAHFHFDYLPNQKLVDGINWDAIGKFVGIRPAKGRLPPRGSVVECHCNLTSVGWFFLESGLHRAGGKRQDGCFYGQRRPGTLPPHREGGSSLNSTGKPSLFIVNRSVGVGTSPTSLVLDRAVFSGMIPTDDSSAAPRSMTMRGASRYLKIHKSLFHAKRVPLHGANKTEADDLLRVVTLLGAKMQEKKSKDAIE